jgi:hypothetical protein
MVFSIFALREREISLREIPRRDVRGLTRRR